MHRRPEASRSAAPRRGPAPARASGTDPRTHRAQHSPKLRGSQGPAPPPRLPLPGPKGQGRRTFREETGSKRAPLRSKMQEGGLGRELPVRRTRPPTPGAGPVSSREDASPGHAAPCLLPHGLRPTRRSWGRQKRRVAPKTCAGVPASGTLAPSTCGECLPPRTGHSDAA